MLREGTLEDISDGKLYSENDMVKADTNSCRVVMVWERR